MSPCSRWFAVLRTVVTLPVPALELEAEEEEAITRMAAGSRNAGVQSWTSDSPSAARHSD